MQRTTKFLLAFFALTAMVCVVIAVLLWPFLGSLTSFESGIGATIVDPRPAVAVVLVRDEFDAPIVGARVEAFREPPPPIDGLAAEFDARATPAPATTATSDAAGTATFGSLGLGRSTIVASAPGRATRARCIDGGHAGRHRITIRLVTPRGIAGRVVDSDGRAVDDAVVLAEENGRSEARPDAVAACRRAPTGRDGTFELRDLPDAPVRLWVARAGDVPFRWGDVSPVQMARVDLVVPRRVDFAGTVTDTTTNRPVADARVTVVFASRLTTVSDPNGAWRVAYTPSPRAPAPGVPTLVVEKPGFYQREVRRIPNTPAGTPDPHLRVASGAKVHGAVMGPDGPVAGVRVRACVFSKDVDESMVEAVAGADGVYAIDGLAPGDVAIFAQPDGVELESARQDVTVRAGDDATCDFRLTKRDCNPVRVHGRVESDDGSPIDGATVRFAGDGSSGPEDFTWTSSAADGMFEFPPLPSAARAQLVVSAPTYRESRGGWTTVGLLASGTTIRLVRGVRIEGRAASKDGRPLAGARVAVAGLPDAATDVDPLAVLWSDDDPTVTDRDGRFVAWYAGDAARFAVATSVDGLAPASSSPFDAASCGATAHADLVLDVGAPIRGVVTDGKNRPLAGAALGVLAESRDAWPIVALTVADAQGKFEIPHLPPRKCQLALVNPGADPTSRWVTPSNTESVAFRIVR